MGTRPDLRIGDADREAAATSLRENYAQGRLSLEEFNQRLDAAFASVTQGQLDQVTSDLPHVSGAFVPLPVSQAGPPPGAGHGHHHGYAQPGHNRRRTSQPRMFLLVMLALWVYALAHFGLFSFPVPMLLAGLFIVRWLARRIFGVLGGGPMRRRRW